MSAVWKIKRGVTIQMTPDSPVWKISNGHKRCELEYKGKYTSLLSAVPSYGASISGYESTLRVIDVEVRRVRGGGMGVMRVTLEKLSSGATAPDGAFDEEPQIELEWQAVEKAIESHPKYRNIHQDHKDLVVQYFADSSSDIRSNIRAALEAIAAADPGPIASPEDPGEQDVSAAAALVLIDLKLKGVEAYTLYAPVARRTRNRSRPPTDGTAGTVETPSLGFTLPSGYEWMKTADRGTKTGTYRRWQRIEEWTGAEQIDGNVYPVEDWS